MIFVMVALLYAGTQPGVVLGQLEAGNFSLDTITLTIPQVDYEPAIYYRDGDPYPHLDLQEVDRQRVIRKDHVAVVMENRYIKLTLLPEMGRVY